MSAKKRWGWATFTSDDIELLQRLADGAAPKQLGTRAVMNRLRVMQERAKATSKIELVVIAMRKGYIK